ncbi:CTP-dependent riboflavin kinase [Candidatus Woesearchaeota archaeon]|nr:CTP-dependent riboflavin kinase [Candidatus Woesearchaeota archaeon]
MYEYMQLLMYIAKKEGLFGSLKDSTLRISRETGISQQTISRKLQEMENKGLITRSATPKGLIVSLDKKGREILEERYRDLKGIFEAKKTAIAGIIQKGIGEGSYYISQKMYQKQIKAGFGFDAFPGTLNIRVNKEELASFLAGINPVRIKGFTTKTRTFGQITAYKIRINNIEGTIVKPERTRHAEDIIEVVAAVNLRDRLRLKDGDEIKIEA